MKDNIYCHNLRLNLDIPEHLEVHGHLMNYDKSKHKSMNSYIIETIRAGADSVDGDSNHPIISEKQLKELENRVTERIRKDVLNEVLKTLLGMAVKPGAIPLYQGQNEEQEDAQEEPINTGLATVALGFFEE